MAGERQQALAAKNMQVSCPCCVLAAVGLHLLLCAPDGVNASATCMICSFTAALLASAACSLATGHLLLTTSFFHFIFLLSCHAFP
jgi:hypothetical protein